VTRQFALILQILASRRLKDVHVEIVVFPYYSGSFSLFTLVTHFTRWPEASLLPDMFVQSLLMFVSTNG